MARTIRRLTPLALAGALLLGGAVTATGAAAAESAGAASRAVVPGEHGCSPHAQATVRRGSSGSAVRHLQCLLNYWGYGVDGVDGIFGTRTQNQVRNFQRDRGLAVDGIVGANTWAEPHY
ncbi:peptidoglycan-binding domain-containing protein [Streptomyces subrutilus]|uniref:peptidoglycan-binding domain-containing protein n=1 Tax=Streptomyces subrutilus TaxID=36818 RepID=UPI0033F9B67D